MAQVVENWGSRSPGLRSFVVRPLCGYEKASAAVCRRYVQDPHDIDDGLPV